MAKSLRSKVKRRWRALKRNIIAEKLGNDQLQQLSQKLQMTMQGINFRTQEPLNAFLHPKNPQAVFPQYIPQKHIDLRCAHQAIGVGGFEFRGAYRRNAEKNSLENQKMDIIAEVEKEKEDSEYSDDDDEDLLVDQLGGLGLTGKTIKKDKKNNNQNQKMLLEQLPLRAADKKKKLQRCKKSKKIIKF